MKYRSGFTLIELLVVIAIIGTLSSIVLSSLSSARSNANDTAAKSQLGDVRAAAALLYETSGSDNTVCDPNTNTGAMYRKAFETSDRSGSAVCIASPSNFYYGNDGSGNIVYFAQIGGVPYYADQWAAYVKLKSGKYYCVDYEGTGTTTTSIPSIGISDRTC